MGKVSIKYKVWLEKDGEIIIGMGREKLLKEIDKTGSIKKAAENLGISYKKAWEYLKAMENRLGKKLVETHKGGKYGGGSQLTPYAKKLISDFEKVQQSFENLKKTLEDG